MTIIQVHNKYQIRGGEDIVVEAERSLLESNGDVVVPFYTDNNEIATYSLVERGVMFATTSWSQKNYHELKKTIRRVEPDVVHVHNSFPLLSPSILYAARYSSVPVVQTLHNFRLLCPAATFVRNGTICELCVKGSLWNSVKHSCYRHSRIGSLAVCQMLWLHRILNTWNKCVTEFIALSNFSKRKFVEGGIDGSKVSVKPNVLLRDIHHENVSSEFALFAGRLSDEKGVGVLLRAWQGVDAPLCIVGSGELEYSLKQFVQEHQLTNVKFAGSLSHDETLNMMLRSSFVLVPSICYENFPLAILEAFACGKPVIASRLGAIAEIVSEGVTGLLCTPGDSCDLQAKILWALAHNEEMRMMGMNARREYDTKYAPEKNYQSLRAIYAKAIERFRGSKHG